MSDAVAAPKAFRHKKAGVKFEKKKAHQEKKRNGGVALSKEQLQQKDRHKKKQTFQSTVRARVP